MWRCDYRPSFHYTYLNPAAVRILDVTLEELAGDEDLAVRRTHPDDRERLLAGRADPAGAAWPMRLRWADRTGAYARLEVREIPIVGPDGEVVATLGIARNLSDQDRESLRAAGRPVARTTGRGRAASRRRPAPDLPAGRVPRAAHPPGRGARLRRDAAAAPPPAARGQRRAAGRPARAQRDPAAGPARRPARHRPAGARHAGRRAAPRPTSPRRCSVRSSSSARRSARSASTSNPSRPQIDAPKFERIVDNLVHNAVRHAGSGATVWVRLTRDGDDLVLVVEDDGPGIAPELRERLFEPFEQGTRASSDASPGTGLGLSLVRQFVALHGGSVRVDDRSEGGARFEVRMPVAAAA